MAHTARLSLSPDVCRSHVQDEDISVVRDVARKTLETLELNIKTCLTITKLSDAITADQGSAFRRWSRGNADLERREFKTYIASLLRKEDCWRAMKGNALDVKSKISGETYTALGSAMMSLQSIDKRLREEIAEPLKKHLIQKTPPDYARFHNIAVPLGEDIFKMGDVIENEFIIMKANGIQSTQLKSAGLSNSKRAPNIKKTSLVSPPPKDVQPLPSDERLAEEGRAGIVMAKRVIAIGEENTRSMSGRTLCT